MDTWKASGGGGSVWRNGERNAEEEASPKRKAAGFLDLDVYNNSYAAMIIVFKKLLPLLPKEERFDLFDQLRRSCKAVPRLIAEGHSKRHQNKGFQKYIDDAHAESNETMVSISQLRDLFAPNNMKELCDELINTYDKISRQLFNLAIAWDNFHRQAKYRIRSTPADSPDAPE